MGTAKDIAALSLLKQLSIEWRELRKVPSELTLEAIQLQQIKVDDIIGKTEDDVKQVKTYAGNINKEVSSILDLVKKSLIQIVDKMHDLCKELVPEKKAQAGNTKFTTAAGKYIATKETSNLRQDGRTGGLMMDTERQSHHNQQIAEQLQTQAKTAAQQQKLVAMLESVSNVCQSIENHDGIDSDGISNLQKKINAYGDTLQNEKERREREERKAAEKQKRDEEEQELKKAEEKRRNPANWKPLIMRDPNGENGLAATDIYCVIYAMPGSVKDSFLQITNMENPMAPKEWLNILYEQQASLPLSVMNKGHKSLDLEMPMEIYVPYVIKNNKLEPEVKIRVDKGTWEYADIVTERKTDAFPKGVKYIGTKLQKFHSFEIVVVAVPEGKAIEIKNAGNSFKEGSMTFEFSRSTFEKTRNVKLGVTKDPGKYCSNVTAAQVHVDSEYNTKTKKDTPVDMSTEKLGTQVTTAQVHLDLHCRSKTQKDIIVNISTEKFESECKETMTAQTILFDFQRSLDVPKTFKIDHFLEELSKMNLIDKKDMKDNQNMKKADERLKHLFDLLCQKPSNLENVLVCLDKSGNKEMAKKIRQRLKEIREKRLPGEEYRPVMVYRVPGGKWNILDPKASARLHKKMGCTLPAGHRYFEFMSLAVPEASTDPDIQLAADRIRIQMLGTTVTLLCRQKGDDQGDTFIHILPTERAKEELKRLKDEGYARGPMELPDFTVADGETIQIHMSGNVGIEHNSYRNTQGETLQIPFKVNKDVSKINCRMYVVDKNDQMDDEKYHGTLHYQIKELEPLEHRSDSVEITWEKLTKGYLSKLSINGEIQALAKFVGMRMKTKEESHAHFSTMDKPAVVKEIEARVAKTCKDESDQVKCETAIFIWANQNQKDNKEKIKIILHAVKSYPWAAEAERFVCLYTDKGLFSEISLLNMSQMLGPEWKELAVYLKVPEVQVSYIESLKLSEQQTKGKLLDKYRLSYHAIQQGETLPQEFVQCLKECQCSDTLVTYVQGKIK